MNTEKTGSILKAYLEGLEQRLQTCQASAERLEKMLEVLGPDGIRDLKNMEERIEASLENKYIGRVDLQHTLYEHSLNAAKKKIKRQIIVGVLTVPFLSLALIFGLAAVMDALK